MIRIHLETGPRRVAEAKAGTREQVRELALAYIWQIHMQTGPRMDAEAMAQGRHSANSLWERVDSCMTVGASIVVAYAGGRGEGVSLSTGVKGSTEVGNCKESRNERPERTASVSVTPLIAPIGRYTNWDFCHV